MLSVDSQATFHNVSHSPLVLRLEANSGKHGVVPCSYRTCRYVPRQVLGEVSLRNEASEHSGMDILEQRKRAFAWLVATVDNGNKAAAGRRIGKDSSYVGRMLSAPKANGHRNIEAKLIDAIHRGYDKPDGWLDTFDPKTGNAKEESPRPTSADNDVRALQMVVAELVRVMVSSAPGEARAFSALLKARADADNFSTETAGLVKEVLRTVELGQRRAEAAVERASQQDVVRKAS